MNSQFGIHGLAGAECDDCGAGNARELDGLLLCPACYAAEMSK